MAIYDAVRHQGELMQYAGFFKRFGAFWIDVIVLLPILALTFWGEGQSRLFQLYWFIPGLIIGLWFHVYLVKKYGGTPGKLLLKIKIAKLDGSDVGYKEAMLRYSVIFVISLLLSASLLPILLEMNDSQYFSMDWQARALYMVNHAPSWYSALNIAMNIWIWSEFIVMLTNKERRALHDFIAGTVVIHKQSFNESSHDGSNASIEA